MKHFLSLIMLLSFMLSCSQRTQNDRPVETPVPVATPLIGTSSATDIKGDYQQNGNGKFPKEANCIDIREAKIETTESGLKLSVTVNGKLPSVTPKDRTAIWQATICMQGGKPCFSLGAIIDGDKQTAYLTPPGTATPNFLEPPVFTNDTVLIMATREELPAWATTSPLEWYLHSNWSGEWHDYLPDRGKNDDNMYVKHPGL